MTGVDDAETGPALAEALKKVDQALNHWRQGDFALGDHWFVHRCEPSIPIAEAAREAADQGVDLGETPVRGLVVVTQSCDIVRRCAERPFVEVSPLVEVNADRLREIEHGRWPGYAAIPTLASQLLVADLDRTMTVEKPVVASWERGIGCRTDPERRAFARALARKRSRFAFPDDFTALAGKLRDRLMDKHGRDSPEGRALRALREVRVHASPSWDSDVVELHFWFLREPGQVDFDGTRWEVHLETWRKLLPRGGRFTKAEGQVAELDDLTARDYVDSDPLDLDHLTAPTPAQR